MTPQPKPFKACQYSAFISYAHADDEAEPGWITRFVDVLEGTVGAQVGRSLGGRMPPMHRSGKTPLVQGTVSDELRARIAESFAMVIVVYDGYVDSDWCVKELQYFHSLQGDQGLKQRLYIVAMSEPAMTRLKAKPSFAALPCADELVWLPFFRRDQPERPVRIRMDNNELSQAFDEQLSGLRKHLAERIKGDVERPAAAVRPPDPRPEPVPAQAVAHVVATRGPLLVGVASSEFEPAVRQLVDALRTLGQRVDVLGPQALNGDFAEFDSAGTLILPFGQGGQPLLPYKFSPGGHLAAQRDTWLGKGRPADALLWLDLREQPAMAPAGPGHAELLASIGAQAVTPKALLARWLPAPTPPPPQLPDGRRINIYIESNQNEVDLWDNLGEQIKKKWNDLVSQLDSALVPPLVLHARGLPLNRIDQHPRLDDADGVVLLWGQKTEDSLRAQIKTIENKLAVDAPPGIVAYLMPPHQDPQRPMEATYWKVLRFNADVETDIDVVRDEVDRLKDFLRKILMRTLRQQQLQARAPATATLP